MGCNCGSKNAIRPGTRTVVYVVDGPDGPETFDMAVTPDAFEMARTRAGEVGKKMRTQVVTR